MTDELLAQQKVVWVQAYLSNNQPSRNIYYYVTSNSNKYREKLYTLYSEPTLHITLLKEQSLYTILFNMDERCGDYNSK